MKILIKGLKTALTELKLLYITSFIVAVLVIIPISNFLLEGFQYIISGNFSLGIAGDEEVSRGLGDVYKRQVYGK